MVGVVIRKCWLGQYETQPPKLWLGHTYMLIAKVRGRAGGFQLVGATPNAAHVFPSDSHTYVQASLQSLEHAYCGNAHATASVLYL